MKIICESMDEYDKLMKASKYLHDFRVSIEDFKEYDENENETGFIDNIIDLNPNDDEIIGLLQHLYLTEDDFPNKRKVVSIENNPNKKFLIKTQTPDGMRTRWLQGNRWMYSSDYCDEFESRKEAEDVINEGLPIQPFRYGTSKIIER